MGPFEIKSTVPGKSLRAKKDLQFEEAFLDAQSGIEEVIEDERLNINFRLVGLILFVCFAVMFGRVYFLQVVDGEEYRDLAEGNKLRTQYILAPRGLITDKFDQVLVNNQPSFELVAIGSDLPESESELPLMLALLAEVLGLPETALQQRLQTINRGSYEPQTLVENISKDQALILISRQAELPGLEVYNSPIRDYKYPEVFAHVLGYTGKITVAELASAEAIYLLHDYIGKTGIELQYEEYLKGLPGSRRVEIDAAGNFKRDLGEIPPQYGANVKLKLDAELQRTIYQSLQKILKQTRHQKAAAIAMEPQTGKILALLSFPSFDTNLFAAGISSADYEALAHDPNFPFLNRSISGTYPPGSTVKPLLAIAGLAEEVITPNTKILDDGVIRIGSYNYYGYGSG